MENLPAIIKLYKTADDITNALDTVTVSGRFLYSFFAGIPGLIEEQNPYWIHAKTYVENYHAGKEFQSKQFPL